MSPVLGLLQFTHSRKAAFAIRCFDLTTEFQPGMLNLPSFFLPVGLQRMQLCYRQVCLKQLIFVQKTNLLKRPQIWDS